MTALPNNRFQPTLVPRAAEAYVGQLKYNEEAGT